MKIGDLVMTNAITVRSEPGPRPSMTAGMKANKGFAFVFLNFGTVQRLDEVDERVEKVMHALGWIAADDIAGLRAALKDAGSREKGANSVTITENNVAAQAGDEPMRPEAILEIWRDCGWASNNGNAVKFARAIITAQVSPRATADVERDAIALLREVVRLDGISLVATIDNCEICTTIEFDKLTDDIRKYLATTKPGA